MKRDFMMISSCGFRAKLCVRLLGLAWSLLTATDVKATNMEFVPMGNAGNMASGSLC